MDNPQSGKKTYEDCRKNKLSGDGSIHLLLSPVTAFNPHEENFNHPQKLLEVSNGPYFPDCLVDCPGMKIKRAESFFPCFHYIFGFHIPYVKNTRVLLIH